MNQVAVAGRVAAVAASYALLALLLAWTLGGQSTFGRIDAHLAIPWLMPGALLIARLTRGDPRPRRALKDAVAIVLLASVQLALHWHLAGRAGVVPLLLSALASVLALAAAQGADALARRWRRIVRWPFLICLIAGWFAAGQGALAFHDRDHGSKTQVVMLTALPLRWSGAKDLTNLLADGPADLPALAAIERAVDLRLLDSLDADPPLSATLFLAHPRALAPAELVRIDAHVRAGGEAVILADALSSWSPPHPLGDPRNPPVTSLLTPLLDHWGIELGASTGASAQGSDAYLGPSGPKLRLYSSGRFVSLPQSCRSFAHAQVAHCRIGAGAVWLVGDADLLHASLWESPVAWAPWLRRSDNMTWLVDMLGSAPWPANAAPLWIRSRRD